MVRVGAHVRRAALVGAAISAFCLSGVAAAQSIAANDYHIAAQDLGQALSALARQAGLQLVADGDLIQGKRSTAVTGHLSLEEALEQVLDRTGLTATISDNTIVIRGRSEPPRDERTHAAESSSDVVVTGSRIRGRAPAGAAVTAIDRTAIEQTGYATTQQLLQALPQNFGGGPNETTAATARGNADFNSAYGSGINLRGLGASSTLVLLNGERPPMAGLAGVFTDLSLIPLSAIGRIEVLPDGASALYGSDAVAGVVNIVPRSDVEGLETSGRIGLADGFTERQASALAGHRWSTGNFLIGYEFYQRGALAAADRPYVSEDLRRYGLGDFRSGAAVPGTIVGGGQFFGIPAGQDGRALAVSALLPGQRNVQDRYLDADALPMQRRHAVLATARQTIGNVELYGQALFGDRQFDVAKPALYNSKTVVVPVTNPFYVDPIGTHQPVQVQYSFLNDLGPERMRGEARAIGLSGGGKLSIGRWQIDAHGTFGTERDSTTSYNLVNSARMTAALADTNPATALNVFGNGSANNPATLATIRGSIRAGGHYRLWGGQLRAEGPLLALPAGDLRLATGVEHRDELYVFDKGVLDTATLTPTVLSTNWTGRRNVTAGYVELAAPLSGAADEGLGVGRLDLSIAARGEHYSDFGNTFNPKVGLSWEPFRRVVLRGSWGTSFRAPNFQDLRQDPNAILYFAYPVPDPTAPGGVTRALIIRGNDPNLGPEKATSWTLGFDVNMTDTPGPFARLTWFGIDYRDRIASPASALLTFFTDRAIYAPIITDKPDPAVVAGYFASPYFQLLSAVTAGQVTAIVDARTQNLARQTQRGIDFDLGYRFDVNGHHGEIGMSGSWLLSFRQQLTATAPTINLVGTIGNPPDLRLRGRMSYGGAPLGAALFVNYIDGYRNNTVTPSQPVASWTTVDFQLSWRSRRTDGPLSGLSIGLNATNLFNQAPPPVRYAVGTNTIGYDVENANPLGQIFSIEVTKRW
ncbi:TonB-dependent receptor [Sphingomonas sp. CL5.1]|uniref:TonB-dependent receptor n=1 Tax=Sphingomonas sp. CL5.1 TaxID=2653203 RepID=UPI0015840EC7|nr:TonB-dependent receptor [Sphingomonas sp. CL5.1]QKR98296.1 TonB-dependent receptor [Sphingomonas sp. CL5.1]